MEDDSYRTLLKPSPEILFKDRKSKFYGYAFPISNTEEVKPIIESLRKEHHTANHVCYAWQLGERNPIYRANDDGEPNNSAGMPIYGQIQSFELTNTLVAVVRYFGGTKLGVGGLIQAYRTAAQMVLEDSEIVERTIAFKFELSFDYPEMNKVMRAIKQHNIRIISQTMELKCAMILSVRERMADEMFQLFKDMPKVEVTSMQ